MEKCSSSQVTSNIASILIYNKVLEPKITKMTTVDFTSPVQIIELGLLEPLDLSLGFRSSKEVENDCVGVTVWIQCCQLDHLF